MKALLLIVAGFMIGGLLFGARGEASGVPATIPVKKAGWEQRWETILSEAKKEGSVAVHTGWPSETRVTLTRAFKNKYGINLAFSPFGRGTELVAKVKAEQRAGLYLADVFGAGNTTLMGLMKPEGFLGPIKPLLILPEVLDPKAWREGNIPFTDSEGQALSLVGQAGRNLAYNANLIKEGELTSYKDLLKPQYKGKITLSDPRVSGAGNAIITHLGRNVWGEAETADFLRRLIKEQEVVIQRDSRLLIESVARGKYAIGMAPTTGVLLQFIGLGAPIKIAKAQEDTNLTASAGAIGVSTKLAHPNATAVFVNWLLTKEGQSVFAKSFGTPATRLDVSTEGFNPLYIPVPGEKYYSDAEDTISKMGKWVEIAKKIIEETAK